MNLGCRPAVEYRGSFPLGRSTDEEAANWCSECARSVVLPAKSRFST
jgi:hypothetical protein